MRRYDVRAGALSALCLLLLAKSVNSQERNPLHEAATVGKHQGYAHSVAYSPDGKMLVSSGHVDKTARLWDIATRKERHLLAGHTGGVMSVQFSPDGKLVASAGLEEGIRLWDPATGKEVRRIDAAGHPYALAFAPDGKTLATSGIDRTVRVWDVQTGKQLVQALGHLERIWCVAYSRDGKRLASGDSSGSVRVWDATTGRELLSLTGHAGGVIPVAFAPDGKRLYSAGEDAKIHVWDLLTGKELPALAGHKGTVHDLRFSPDGRYLASAGWEDFSVRLWEVATHKEVVRIEAHTAAVCNVAFAPDGRSIASAGRDAAVRVWDVTGRVEKGKFAQKALAAKELEARWVSLQGEDAAAAYRAAWELIASPKEVVPFFQGKLRAGKPDPDAAKKVAKLIEELGDKQFGVRDRASHLLGKMGRAAEAALRQALDTETSAEVRSRIKALLEKLEDLAAPPESIPLLRAVMVLEQIGTPEAQKQLKEVAGGTDDVRLAQEAKDSLQRLSKK